MTISGVSVVSNVNVSNEYVQTVSRNSLNAPSTLPLLSQNLISQDALRALLEVMATTWPTLSLAKQQWAIAKLTQLLVVANNREPIKIATIWPTLSPATQEWAIIRLTRVGVVENSIRQKRIATPYKLEMWERSIRDEDRKELLKYRMITHTTSAETQNNTIKNANDKKGFFNTIVGGLRQIISTLGQYLNALGQQLFWWRSFK